MPDHELWPPCMLPQMHALPNCPPAQPAAHRPPPTHNGSHPSPQQPFFARHAPHPIMARRPTSIGRTGHLTLSQAKAAPIAWCNNTANHTSCDMCPHLHNNLLQHMPAHRPHLCIAYSCPPAPSRSSNPCPALSQCLPLYHAQTCVRAWPFSQAAFEPQQPCRLRAITAMLPSSHNSHAAFELQQPCRLRATTAMLPSSHNPRVTTAMPPSLIQKWPCRHQATTAMPPLRATTAMPPPNHNGQAALEPTHGQHIAYTCPTYD